MSTVPAHTDPLRQAAERQTVLLRELEERNDRLQRELDAQPIRGLWASLKHAIRRDRGEAKVHPRNTTGR
jgi:hypothetical protein